LYYLSLNSPQRADMERINFMIFVNFVASFIKLQNRLEFLLVEWRLDRSVSVRSHFNTKSFISQSLQFFYTMPAPDVTSSTLSRKGNALYDMGGGFKIKNILTTTVVLPCHLPGKTTFRQNLMSNTRMILGD